MKRMGNRFRRLALCSLACASLLAACDKQEAPAPEAKPEEETVVLLHGLGRTRASILVLQQRLKSAGYQTLNFPYGTINTSIDEMSEALHLYIRENVKTPRYHFIGHSLGNIIVRNGFKSEYPPGLGRIVMLAPPNQPSELARTLKNFGPFKWRAGDSGQQLASEDFYKDLPAPSVEFGVIAGDKGQSLTFDVPNDGVITVESTKLDGMKDWLLLHHSHTFIMNSKDTAQQCLRFLREGSFDHAAPRQEAEPQ